MKINKLFIIRKSQRSITHNFGTFIKWTVIAVVIGAATGLIGSAFNFLLSECALFRERHHWAVLALPLCGLMIIWFYHLLGFRSDKGTNMVLVSVRDGENMTWRNTVSIFVGTVLTHLGGGSSGREGAALQMGSSIGSQIGLWLRLDKQDHRLITMCGMSAGFSALFGTPVSAALFSMEVISVGIMHYSAIVPCVISSITGIAISSQFGVKALELNVINEGLSLMLFFKTALIAVLCGLLSIIFCYTLKKMGALYRYFVSNHYLRIVTGGVIVTGLMLLIGSLDYSGAGGPVIVRFFSESAKPWDFALKILLTALTLSAGYKGGEILPVFFAGSAFGSFIAPLLNMDCSFGAALGLCSLFCGVTNCPITAIMLSIELFGTENLILYVLACGISYMLSGYAGLYSEQKIVYSKIEPKYIDKKVGKLSGR